MVTPPRSSAPFPTLPSTAAQPSNPGSDPGAPARASSPALPPPHAQDVLVPSEQGAARVGAKRGADSPLPPLPVWGARRARSGAVSPSSARPAAYPALPTIAPADVRSVLARSVLADGYELVFDPIQSRGQHLFDGLTGTKFLDFFTFYASRALAFDHPGFQDAAYKEAFLRAAASKPSNGDVYTSEYAAFVKTFREVAMPAEMKHVFFIDGGALAVENAMKAAFDWKAKKNRAAGREVDADVAIHFRSAFHGRSGYTGSLTNTDPVKTAHFPKFAWPRITPPVVRAPLEGEGLAHVEAAEAAAVQEIEAAFAEHGPSRIACIVIEPIQGEGGDRHMRPEFFAKLRELCDRHEALLVFDEVQTGMGATGTMWYYQQLGVVPDLVAFSKKAQTGGFMASSRLDEVRSVFEQSSRISSTWGGNLADFVRATRILQVIQQDNLLENARNQGQYLLERLTTLADGHPELLSQPRGAGLIAAIDVKTPALRDAIIDEAWKRKLIILPSGPSALRLRPALDVRREDCEEAMSKLEAAVAAVAGR